jgi:hypothetical protein
MSGKNYLAHIRTYNVVIGLVFLVKLLAHKQLGEVLQRETHVPVWNTSKTAVK